MSGSRRQKVREFAIGYYRANGVWPSGSKAAAEVGYDLRDTHRVIQKLKKKLAAGDLEGFAPPMQIEKRPDLVETDETIRKIIESDQLHVEVQSLTINTIEQALVAANVDMEVWKVRRGKVNSWQTTMKVKNIKPGTDQVVEEIVSRTNFQVLVDLEPRIKTSIDAGLKMLLDRLSERAAERPKTVAPLKHPTDEFVFEIALFDAHFGKLAWNAETKQGDYDIQTAEEYYVNACQRLLEHASSFKIEKILFPFGNDFFHVNNPEGLTPTGRHQLDMDTRLPKIWTAGKMAMIKALDFCLQVAPVELVWVPGNHDPETSFFLTEVLAAYYRGNRHVSVDNSPAWRKARLYGNFLVAFTHAATEKIQKLPNMMLVEFPEMMVKARFKEWHIGHIHKKDEYKFQPTMTEAGVIVRRIPALSKIDAWHYRYGFVDAVPAGEAFLIDKQYGVVNHITCNS